MRPHFKADAVLFHVEVCRRLDRRTRNQVLFIVAIAAIVVGFVALDLVWSGNLVPWIAVGWHLRLGVDYVRDLRTTMRIRRELEP